MTLVESFHEQHKARLVRLRAVPQPLRQVRPQPKPIIISKPPADDVQLPYYPQMWFYDVVMQRASRMGPLRISDIQRAVESHFGLTKLEILSRRNIRHLARARQIGMYLSSVLTLNPINEIGRRFGRDHSTVAHGIRAIENLLTRDPAIQSAVAAIKARLSA